MIYADESKAKYKDVNIEDEMKNSYIDYAMSVIVGRALPDIRDGLKPVHRRILFSMYELGMPFNKPYKKSARVVGEVLGKYHPHGDSSVYDALVRMVQDFSLRYPLINGQGNFGSVDGDPPAAMRYTEVRMHRITEELLKDLDKETVRFTPNFDGTLMEPAVMPSVLPNLLVNGSSGIAVGMATNIPPHNLTEVVDGIIAVIDDPELQLEDLIKIIKGPDFPTGGSIIGRDGIVEAYETGRGKLLVRAKAVIEHQPKGNREFIIITEIPYMVNKANLIEKIADLVKEKKIDGITDLRDESDRDGMRIVVELRRDAIPKIILNRLYDQTQMQVTFGIILLSLVENQPRVLTLKRMITLYIEHRKRIVIARTEYELREAEKKAHILEGLKIALDHLDAVIKTIRSSTTPPEACTNLMLKFKLSEIQSKAILDMKLQRLTGLEREKIENEYLETIKLIEKLKSILASEKKILGIIREELLALKKNYGDPRRTEIIETQTEMKIEDLIAEEEMALTISHTGYIKRIPVSTYKNQRRGGKGILGMETKDEDWVEHLFIASTHDDILFFTKSGKVFWLKVYEIPEGSRIAKGKAIVNLLNIEREDTITAFVPVKDFTAAKFLVMITTKGVIKKTSLDAYSNPRVGGIIAIDLDKGDELKEVKITSGQDDLIIATRKGKAVRFHETEVRGMGRTARGVRGINLGKDDIVIGTVVYEKEGTLLTITENGYGKRSKFEDYRITKRGGKGVINVRTTSKNGDVVAIHAVVDDDELMLITQQGTMIRTLVKYIPVLGRATQGVTIQKMKGKDKVMDVARIVKRDDVEEENGAAALPDDSAPEIAGAADEETEGQE